MHLAHAVTRIAKCIPGWPERNRVDVFSLKCKSVHYIQTIFQWSIMFCLLYEKDDHCIKNNVLLYFFVFILLFLILVTFIKAPTSAFTWELCHLWLWALFERCIHNCIMCLKCISDPWSGLDCLLRTHVGCIYYFVFMLIIFICI